MSVDIASAVRSALEGHYEIVSELGRGGTAVVYLGRERATGTEVAIKVIRARYVEDEETLGRFAREARYVGELHHPNVVALRAVVELGALGLALVMNHVRGRTLKQLIQERGPLDPATVESVLRDVARALGAAHARGIVHRDVKPENVFVDDAGRALLSDFGVARSMTSDTQLTMSGIAIGTPAYMAPEQIDGARVDGRGDVYSLGLVGWEMLTGNRPWQGSGLYAVIYQQKHEELPDVRDIRSDVPDRLADVIGGAIEKDPAARWQSADEVIAALDGTAIRRAPRPRPAVTAEETRRFVRPAEPPSPPFRRRLAIGAGALAALIASLGVMLSTSQADSRRPSGATGNAVIGAQAGAPTGTQAGAPARVETRTSVERAGDVATRLPPMDPPRTETLHVAVPAPAVVRETSPETVESPTADVPSTRISIAAGGAHSCVVAASGRAFCWGGNDRGQLGTGNTTRLASPEPVAADLRFASIASGLSHSCALTRGGAVWCWGDNARGQLGDGSFTSRPAPVPVGDERAFRDIAAGAAHSCAIDVEGRAWCWGAGASGQLGGGDGVGGAPVAVATDGKFAGIATGWEFTCGLAVGGAAVCWGDNSSGQLGDGTRADRRTPTAVRTTMRFTAIAAGSHHACALTAAGEAHCWGRNARGQLGDGTTGDRTVPVRVESTIRFVAISAGAVHTCAITREGAAYCWGQNAYGQLGDGGTTDRTQPVAVAGDHAFARVRAFGSHTCGATSSGEAFCWGYNLEGQLGDGTRIHRTRPVYVELPHSR